MTANRRVLPPIPSSRDAVELEVYFVDRPVGDTLTGEALWKSLNQAASGSLSKRVQLQKSGVRYGIAPSNAPNALQALLDHSRSTSTARQTRMVPLAIPTGESTMIEAALLPDRRTIPSADKARTQPLEVTDARCKFRMAAERVQDGWIRITLLPEIHHGRQHVRPVATERAFVYQDSQDIEQYFDNQFSVELNTGEYLVMGLAGDDLSSLGGLFFRGGDPAVRTSRLMIVRLVGMHEVTAVRDTTRR